MKDEHALFAGQVNAHTRLMQEGKLTNGQTVPRVHRSLPMFTGVLVTGFLDSMASWITLPGCYNCGEPEGIARCCMCQCGICQRCGLLLARASQKNGDGEWQGASLARCKPEHNCLNRQRLVLDHWKRQTGETLDA